MLPDRVSGPGGQRTSANEIFISVCLDCGLPVPASLVELARMDLIMLTDRPLRFGTQVQVAIYSDLVSAVTHNRAIVHWCRPHPGGWQIGAFLAYPIPDRLTEHCWSDLRNNLRYECNWKAWALFDQCGSLESIRITNYSLNGMRIRLERKQSPQGTLSIFTDCGQQHKSVIQAQIQWCREVDGHYEAGCLIQGQRGRDLPRMFGRLDAVHIEDQPESPQVESMETLKCAQTLEERFLNPEQAKISRRLSDEDWYDLSNIT